MAPLKPQHHGRIIDLVQWMGLIVLIGFVYRHFGPEARTPITPAVIGVFWRGSLSCCWVLSVEIQRVRDAMAWAEFVCGDYSRRFAIISSLERAGYICFPSTHVTPEETDE